MRAQLCMVALVWLATARAHGQEARGPALNWTRQPGAESCIGSVELAARIEERLKKHIFVAAPQAIVAVEGYAAPLPNGEGFVANIALSDGQGALFGSRELHASGDCRQLDEGLVFVIAVSLRPEGDGSGIALPEPVARALDALFGEEPTEPEPAAFAAEPAAQREPASEPASAEVRAAPEPREPPEPWALELEGNALALSGLQPVGTFGGGAGLRVRLGGAGSLALGAALSATTTRRIEDGDLENRATFDNRWLTLSYCTPAVLRSEALEAAPCALGRVGATRATGTSFEARNASGSSVFVAVGLVGRVRWAFAPRLSLALTAGLQLHAARPQLVYVSQRGTNADLYTASLFGAVGELSLAFALF